MSILTGFLRQTCLWQTPVSYTVNNVPILSIGQTVKCRWVKQSEFVTDAAGDVIAIDTVVYLEMSVTVGDVLTYNTDVVKIVSIREFVSFNGVSLGVCAKCQHM
jgi:hypothetical protein